MSLGPDEAGDRRPVFRGVIWRGTVSDCGADGLGRETWWMDGCVVGWFCSGVVNSLIVFIYVVD
jgi:hypothetical protein